MVTSAVILLPSKAAALSALGLSFWCNRTLWLSSQCSDALQGGVFPAVFFTFLWNTVKYIVEHIKVHYAQSSPLLQVFAMLMDGLSPLVKRICTNLLLRWTSPELEDMKRDTVCIDIPMSSIWNDYTLTVDHWQKKKRRKTEANLVCLFSFCSHMIFSIQMFSYKSVHICWF